METLNDLMSIVAVNVKARRNKKLMTIDCLATAAGVSKTEIISIEKGKKVNPTTDTLISIAGILGCKYTELFESAEDKQFTDPGKDYLFFEETVTEELEEDVEYQKYMQLQKVYYPPISNFNEISSLLEFFIVLPLLDSADLYESLYRIGGYEIDRELYISEQFDYCWQNVPDSAAKRYAEKRLKRIREIRNGNTDYEIPADEETKKECKAYSEVIIRKRDSLLDFDYFLSSYLKGTHYNN